MKSKLYAVLISTLVIAAGCATMQEGTSGSSSSVSTAPEVVRGDQLRATVSGKTFEGRSSEGFNVRAYNAPDGKKAVESSSGGKTYKSGGTWEIRDNTFCDKFDNPDWKGRCWTMTREGDVAIFKSTTGGLSVRGKFLDGNPYNL